MRKYVQMGSTNKFIPSPIRNVLEKTDVEILLCVKYLPVVYEGSIKNRVH